MSLSVMPLAAPLDPPQLRQAWSRFGTVVTTGNPEGQRLGVTLNSFDTVSLRPPIVRWSLSWRAPSLEGFRRAGRDREVGDPVLICGEVAGRAQATLAALQSCPGRRTPGVSLPHAAQHCA